MPEPVIIAVLAENSVHTCGLLAEYGLAFHLQSDKRSLLFDTGQSDLLLRNACELGVNLAWPNCGVPFLINAHRVPWA